MKTFEIETLHGKYEGLTLTKGRYQGKAPAIQIWTEEGELFATLTVYVKDNSLAENEAYLDTNNCPWAVAFVENNKLGERTGKTGGRGFCAYPLVRFNMEKLNEVCGQVSL